MAVMQLENGRTYRDIGAIASQLAVLNVQIDRLPMRENPAVRELLAQDILNVQKNSRYSQHFKASLNSLSAQTNVSGVT